MRKFMESDNDFQKQSFELCLAVYRLADLMPENEILARQIKESVNEITADILVMERLGDNLPINMSIAFIDRFFNELPFKIIRHMEKLIGYLEIAQAQDWVNPVNFDVLIKGYRKIISQVSSRPALAISAQRQKEMLKGRSPEAYGIDVEKYEEAPGIKTAPAIKKAKLVPAKPSPAKALNSRQKKILEHLKKHKEAKMADFTGIFKKEITERTLRNDLREMVEQNIIKPEGEFKSRKYYIK